jgi:hypothetical protein
MNQFLLFAGAFYYASGGWDDFVDSFDTVEEAHDYVDVAAKERPQDYDWHHIVDSNTGEMV